MVNATIAMAGMRTYLFTDSLNSALWLPAFPTGWGQLKALTSVASVMENELNTIVQEVSCR